MATLDRMARTFLLAELASGMALTLGLHTLAFLALALVQYIVNMLGGGRIGFLIAAAPLLL